MILLSLYLCFLAAKQLSRRKRRKTVVYITTTKTAAQIERERKQTERERAAAEKRQAQIEQANSDIGHFSENLDGLYRMQADTMRLLAEAQKEVDTDNQFNQYGAVISVKTAARHIAKRDKYQKQLFTINNQIHNAEKQKRKAERIINGAGQ